jgi:hypothetical protein
MRMSKRIAGLLSRSCLHHVNGGVYTRKVKKTTFACLSCFSSPRHQIMFFNSSMHGFSSSSEKKEKEKEKEKNILRSPFKLNLTLFLTQAHTSISPLEAREKLLSFR